jgi:hypothetical protein
VDTSGTIADLYDNLTVYKILINSGTTYRADANTRGYELWTNFTDVAGCGFVSTSSGTLQLTGASSGPGANITTADGTPPPTNYWAGVIGSTTAILDYATLSYFTYFYAATGTIDIDDSTLEYSSTHGLVIAAGTTVTSATNIVLDNLVNPLRLTKQYTAFDNIQITNIISGYDINLLTTNIRDEFANSNFDTSNVGLLSNCNIISDTHNDVANAYKVMATTLSKSTITNDYASLSDVQLVSGTFTIDEASVSNDYTVDSGATLVLNTGLTHTFDTDANLTNNGLLKTDGTITTSSGYFDLYTPGSAYLNNTTVSNVDFNYYLGGFNFTVGRAANSTIADLTLEAPDVSGGDTAFNLTSDTWNNKGSGAVWDMNVTATERSRTTPANSRRSLDLQTRSILHLHNHPIQDRSILQRGTREVRQQGSERLQLLMGLRRRFKGRERHERHAHLRLLPHGDLRCPAHDLRRWK